jgi:hypothetical protein
MPRERSASAKSALPLPDRGSKNPEAEQHQACRPGDRDGGPVRPEVLTSVSIDAGEELIYAVDGHGTGRRDAAVLDDQQTPNTEFAKEARAYAESARQYIADEKHPRHVRDRAESRSHDRITQPDWRPPRLCALRTTSCLPDEPTQPLLRSAQVADTQKTQGLADQGDGCG